MKIGFYGNANNYPFMLARALRRAGSDVIFIVASRDVLNRPENRYGDISDPYPIWIRDCSTFLRWRNLLPGPMRRTVLKTLNSCDFVILNEEGPALAAGLQVPHAVFLTGSDLTTFANPIVSETLLPRWLRKIPLCGDLLSKCILNLILVPLLVQRQQRGISSARFVSYFNKGLVPAGDTALSELGVEDSRRTFFVMTDQEIISERPFPDNERLRIFCATRLTWKHESDSGLSQLDYKGSDVMIRGIGLFHRKTNVSLDVQLVRKGKHLSETIELIETEGVKDQVTWSDEMTQREVLEEFYRADIIFEQLAEAVCGMAALDALAVGRPVIANNRGQLIAHLTDDPFPICQARTAEEVAAQLERLVASRELRENIGRQGRSYALRHFSADRAAKEVLHRIQRTNLKTGGD